MPHWRAPQLIRRPDHNVHFVDSAPGQELTINVCVKVTQTNNITLYPIGSNAKVCRVHSLSRPIDLVLANLCIVIASISVTVGDRGTL